MEDDAVDRMRRPEVRAAEEGDSPEPGLRVTRQTEVPSGKLATFWYPSPSTGERGATSTSALPGCSTSAVTPSEASASAVPGAAGSITLLRRSSAGVSSGAPVSSGRPCELCKRL